MGKSEDNYGKIVVEWCFNGIYPLVMTNSVLWKIIIFSGLAHKKMVIVHSYVKLSEGKFREIPGKRILTYPKMPVERVIRHTFTADSQSVGTVPNFDS